ncbi:MAG: U32 family peptidase [Clostridia bacterium]|nr:U32 family peptidase [Clostridia bacterium]
MKRLPELLAPAGDMEKLRFAAAYGADAVYFAGDRFGMRASAGNFDADGLRAAAEYCRARSVRAFVTVNSMLHGRDMEALPEYLRYLDSLPLDALIVADMGAMAAAKKYAPSLKLHVSTQASITNAEAAAEYHRMGASRVVLARELSLDEIKRIREGAPTGLEIETFVHGSMCMAYSGRCILSNFLTGRDANGGACAQPCRWKYSLVEETRPGEYMPVREDAGGTYIFNSKDLCMLEHIALLAEAGIDSLKIEGRAKSFYYAAVTTGAYRRALDMYGAGEWSEASARELLRELDKVSHRQYYTGFYFGGRGEQRTDSSEYIREWDVCAVVLGEAEDGACRLQQKNKLFAADALELLTPDGYCGAVRLADVRGADGEETDCVNVPNMEFTARLPVKAPEFSILRKEKSRT